MKKEPKAKRAKAQRPVQRETKEVLAELVEKLKGKLELKATSARPAEASPRGVRKAARENKEMKFTALLQQESLGRA